MSNKEFYNHSIEEKKNKIENYLRDYFKDKDGYEKILFESMYYSLSIGGKRIRPLLMLLTYEVFGKNYEDILNVACAMEMIHTYSLIHDDLPCMDNDDLRRGKPTNHKVFGEAIAVLAGDALLNEAHTILIENAILNGEKALKALEVISKSSGSLGMIAGQIVDMESEGKAIDEEELLFMHKNKTGKLIEASIVSGGILGNANENELNILRRYGENLGLAFQIKDDILDVTGNTQSLGKTAKSDLENSKTNFITMYGIIKCKDMCMKLTEESLELLKKLNKNTTYLQELTLFLLNRES